MVIARTLEEALAARPEHYATREFAGSVSRYFEDAAGRGPQAYRVHQDAGWVLPLHYHDEDEYQIVTGGSGTLGPHALVPLSVHYASRQAAYGPIVAGPQGLQYFTLRRHTDPNTWYLPASRQRMDLSLRKQQVTAPVRAVDGERGTRAVIEPRADGMAAWCTRAAPGETLLLPSTPGGGGRFHFVVTGGFVLEGKALGWQACIYACAEEHDLSLQACDTGGEILTLQFPGRDVAG